MSLCEEMKPQVSDSEDAAKCFSRINHAAHDEISEEINAFLRSGGKIDEVPIGATADPMAYRTIRNEFNGNADYAQRLNKRQKAKISESGLLFDGNNRAKNRSKYGQNIQKRCSGNNEHYIVYIGNKTWGTGLMWSNEQAKSERDKIRYSLGMPAADY